MRFAACCLGLVVASLAALGAIRPVPAIAQKQPIQPPGVDYEADYRMSGEMGGLMQMRYGRQTTQARIEMAVQGQQMVAVHDLRAGVSRMWSSAMAGMIMRVESDRKAGLAGEPTTETRRVLGESCIVWRTEQGELCLAADGVPLAFAGGRMKAEAVRLERKAQPAGAFDLPKGQEMPLKLGQGIKLPLPF